MKNENDFKRIEKMLSELELPRAEDSYIEELCAIPNAKRRSSLTRWRIPLAIAAGLALMLGIFFSINRHHSEPQVIAEQEPELEPTAPEAVAQTPPKIEFMPLRRLSSPETYKVTRVGDKWNAYTLVFAGAERILSESEIRRMANELIQKTPAKLVIAVNPAAVSRKVEWKYHLTPEEAREYQTVSEDSYWVATNDLGIVQADTGESIRLLQHVWVDKQIAASKTGGPGLEIIQSRGEFVPAPVALLAKF